MALPTFVPVLMMLISAAATAYSSYEQYQAGEEAKDIADRNAQRVRDETTRQVEISKKRAKRQEGLARARAFASGLSGKSHDVYLSDLESNNREEVAWILRSGASRADIESRRGSLAARQARIGMISTGIQGVTSAVNWWSQYKPATPTSSGNLYAPY